MKLSARNKLKGKITEVTKGAPPPTSRSTSSLYPLE
jgi:hypothetical protein